METKYRLMDLSGDGGMLYSCNLLYVHLLRIFLKIFFECIIPNTSM